MFQSFPLYVVFSSAIPCKNLQAHGAQHYHHQYPFNSQKSTSAINAYVNVSMTKSQNETNKKRRSTSIVNAYINIKVNFTASKCLLHLSLIHI